MDSFPHDSVNHDRLYSASDFRDYFTPFVNNGIFAEPANSCMVMAVGSDRKVVVKAGRCFINGCVGHTDGTERFIIPASDIYLARYDLIVVRFDLEERDMHIELIKGEPSTEPVYPKIERSALKYDIALAAIKSVPTEYDISQSDITDLRFDMNYCGIVSGLVRITDTTDLFAQYQEIWDKFVAQLGADDRITINTADIKARKNIMSVKVQLPFDMTGLMKI